MSSSAPKKSSAEEDFASKVQSLRLKIRNSESFLNLLLERETARAAFQEADQKLKKLYAQGTLATRTYYDSLEQGLIVAGIPAPTARPSAPESQISAIPQIAAVSLAPISPPGPSSKQDESCIPRPPGQTRSKRRREKDKTRLEKRLRRESEKVTEAHGFNVQNVEPREVQFPKKETDSPETFESDSESQEK